MKRGTLKRFLVADVSAALVRRPELVHVLTGARQTGKTTVAEQVGRQWAGPVLFESADLPVPPGPEWIETHWNRARRLAREKRRAALLILDEVQKVQGWNESVKRFSDEDRRHRAPVRSLILGSSALLVQKGLTESLAGRFFLHRSPHWSFDECRRAFGWDLDQWLFYGGYPGAARMIPDEDDWRSHVADSLIETAVARDVLQMQTVAKPALMRHLFGLCAQYPAQILSYNKMLGTLQDAGNTVTLAHYLRLLEAAFLVSGLDRISARKRVRGSSPKLVMWNNALTTALSGLPFEEAREDSAGWGRIVENAVGGHLLNYLHPPKFAVGYWREGNDEVDYVVTAGRKMTGIEVKSGQPGRQSGVAAFRRRFPAASVLVIGAGGIGFEEFFSHDPSVFCSFS